MLAAAERGCQETRLSAKTSAATRCRIGLATSRSGWRRSRAMAALEADARLAAEEERRIEAEKEQQRQAEGRKSRANRRPPRTS